MASGNIIVQDNTQVEVVEVETHTEIITTEEVATQIEVLSQGPPGPPSFPDAPSDGKMYARKDGAWVEIS